MRIMISLKTYYFKNKTKTTLGEKFTCMQKIVVAELNAITNS